VDKVVAGQETFSGKENHCILLKHLVRPQEQNTFHNKESMPIIQAARNAILLYIKETGNADFVDGKMIFYRKPNFRKNTAYSLDAFRDCSAFVPKYLQKNRCPL
jgi:hypothetical protein